MNKRMRMAASSLALAAGLLVAGCHGGSSQAAHAPVAPAEGIAWREGDVDDAFAEAKETGKPVLLYWGAKWCPPCNQMKTTLFRDPAFIAQTRNFIPVHLDGDSKGAQSWGERFGIAGYPTVIILRPDRTEITRLASGSAAATLGEVLRLAATRNTSLDDLLKRAAADPAALKPEDWRLLANYEWLNDPKRFADPTKAAPLLAKLAAAAPDPALERHFALVALSTAVDGDKPAAKLTSAQQQQAAQVLPAILADYAEVKADPDNISIAAAPLIAALPDPALRQRLDALLIAATDRLYADPSLSVGDRLVTGLADVGVAKAETGNVPAAVLAKVRQRVAWVDGAAKGAIERQAVISNAADLLDAAGDNAGATRLLVAELPRSAEPYYYMLDLSDLAAKRKDNKAAIDWARRAALAAQGPATRVQWAAAYAQTVLQLAPGDKAQVEASVDMVIDALGGVTGDYAERTQRKVATLGGALRAWASVHDGGAVLQRIEARMSKVCAQLGSGKAACDDWTVPAKT